METSFRNADEAFKYYYNLIHSDGIDFGDTRTLFNIGFTLRKPKETWITSTFRQWNEKYAEAEWVEKLIQIMAINGKEDIN